MPIQGSKSNSRRRTDLAVNANALPSTTTPIKMGSARKVGVYISADSGPHTNHIMTLQASGDGSKYFNTPHTITGTGALFDIDCICTHVRVKVTTAQGVASTVDVSVVVK
jgi:hypothetical protein